MFIKSAVLCLAPRGNMILPMITTFNIRYVFRHKACVLCCTMLYNTMLYYAIHVYMRLRCGLNWSLNLDGKCFGAKMQQCDVPVTHI